MFALLTFEVVAMQCNSILVRKQTKPSSTLVIKLMLILHTKFRSDNSREKNTWNFIFSGFTQVIILIYLLLFAELHKICL